MTKSKLRDAWAIYSTLRSTVRPDYRIHTGNAIRRSAEPLGFGIGEASKTFTIEFGPINSKARSAGRGSAIFSVVTMINIACLDKQWFRAMLSGHKHVEYRERKRRDSRLEAIQPGELALFMERGSDRALLRTVRQVESIEQNGHILYAIYFDERVSAIRTNFPHLQGWQRREKLW